MHLVKWIRKNERQIMAWVVILIMISFVGGYGFQQLMENIGRGGSKRVVATYDDGQKIRAINFQQAQNELEILRSLMVDRMLMLLSQINGDLGPNLLELILFPDVHLAGELQMQLIQLVERGQLALNVDQINQFFTPHDLRPEFLWILLKAEARQAGCVVTDADATRYLRQMITGMTQDQDAASRMINQVVQSTKKSESQIIQTFANLVSVMNYADLVLGNYAVTSDEIRVSISRNMERLTAEYLSIEAQPLVNEQPEPTAEQIENQFQQYQSERPGIFTEDNPYGFGYQIPKRIQVEYFLINMNDVREQIEKPTPEELESYYSRHLSQFRRPVPTDPNNPDAGTRQVIQPFAQVVFQIRQDMERQKTEDLANIILNEARQLTESGFDTLEYETVTIQKLQQAAGDYVAPARELSRKYQVSIYTGKTGLMRPVDMRNDLFLRQISIPTSTDNTVRLMDVLLAIPPDGKPSSQPGLPGIRIWENISPLSSGLLSEDNQYIPLRAMIRVTDIRPPTVPEDLNVEFEKNGITLSEPEEKDVFSLRQQVADDVKTIQAMKTAEKQAEILTALVEKEGWDTGLEQFYETYYPQTDPNTPLPSRPQLRSQPNQPVVSRMQLEIMRQRLLNPSYMTDIVASRYRNALLIRTMAELMEPDQQTTGSIARILPFEQTRQVCVVKELTRQPATEKDFQENKNRVALQLAMLSKIDLGLIHFNPANIAKRMDFSYVMPEEEPTEIKVEIEEQEL